MDYDRTINKRRSVSSILHNLISVAVCWKVQIQPDIASDSTDGEIRYMYNAVKKTKVTWRYMGALGIHTGALIVHWKENTSCIYVVEANRVTTRVTHDVFTGCSL